jgi:DNA-binding LacI/PurR family transcriptional regulator
MGMTAAKTLVERISAAKNAEYPRNIVVEPELIVRGSTAAAS